MKLALDGHESKVCFFIKILNSVPTRDPPDRKWKLSREEAGKDRRLRCGWGVCVGGSYDRCQNGRLMF